MQGGLLTGLLTVPRGQETPPVARPRALAIGIFLAAKLFAYTLLGALLGAFGSVLQLAPSVQAGLMIGIGLFMVANGLRLLDLHPIFRRFLFEPPASIRRLIRHRSGAGPSWATPMVLGLFTIFLPCGLAQVMMATALGTGDPRRGAAILFAFTLGSTPVFFAVVYLASRLSTALLEMATPLVAILLVGLGLVPINQGLTLAGSPVTWSKVMDRAKAPTMGSSAALAPPQATPPVIEVSEDGYAPNTLHLKANQEVILIWRTRGTDTCARTVIIPTVHGPLILPASGQVPLKLPPQKKGTVFDYSCSMGMYDGQIIFDLD